MPHASSRGTVFVARAPLTHYIGGRASCTRARVWKGLLSASVAMPRFDPSAQYVSIANISHGGVTKQLVLYEGMPDDELQLVVQASFNLPENIVGVVDEAGLFFAFTSLPALGGQAELTLDGPQLRGVVIPHFTLVLGSPDADPAALKLTQLEKVPFQDLVRFVLGLNKHRLTLSDVAEIVDALARSDQQLAEQLPELQRLFGRLYGAFEPPDAASVHALHFLSGIVMLCAGDRDVKMNAMFNLYDAAGQGSLSQGTLSEYLSAVFTVVAESSPRVFSANETTPTELASDTAAQCFAETHLDSARGDEITFEQFQQWYARHPGQPASPTETPDADVFKNVERLTVLEVSMVSELFRLGSKSVDAEDFEAFLLGYAADSSAQTARDLRACAAAIFNLYGDPATGTAAVNELACCLSILCKGSGVDKGKAAFQFFDINQDGFISPAEMTLYLECVFTILLRLNGNEAEQMTPSQLATATAQQCFNEADANGDGRLSFAEFQSWYSNRGSTTEAPTAQTGPHSVSFGEVQRLTGLGSFNVDEVFELFAEATDEDGMISIEAFEACFEELVDASGHQLTADELDRLRLILSRLYEVFDSDRDGLVDFTELSTGLAALCGGTRDDKVAAAFALYDYNGDGVISLEEMTRYLTCVFKVVYETQPGTAERVGVPAAQLARVTAEQAFQDADVDYDGSLTFEEFKAWYSQGANRDFDESAAHAAQAAAEAAPSWVSLDEVRRLTGLGSFTVDEVFELFAEATDDDGMISVEAFEACFEELVDASGEELTEDDLDRLRLILSRLYETFDADGDGVVDFTELSTGLSVLCGGTRDEKAAAAFALYDYNGDGVISLEEMTRYLTCVFKVMYETQPGTAERVGVSAEELAIATAEQAFEEADADKDGTLTLQEFQAWFFAPGQHSQDDTTSVRDDQVLLRVALSSDCHASVWALFDSLSNAGVVSVTHLYDHFGQTVQQREFLRDFLRWFKTAPDGTISSEAWFDGIKKISWSPSQNPTELAHNARSRVDQFVNTCVSFFFGKRADHAALSLDDVRTITGLSAFTAEEVFEVFAEGADEKGLISSAKYEDCFELLVDASGVVLTEEGVDHLHSVLSTLFNIFVNETGSVDFLELCTGLSVLCGGHRDDRVAATFMLYDFNNDGVISLPEMCRYLTSVFKVMYALHPASASAVQIPPDRLAQITAVHAFEEADVDKNGTLSFAEFRQWYSHNPPSPTMNPPRRSVEPEAVESASVSSKYFSIRNAFGLESVNVDDLFVLLAGVTDDHGCIAFNAMRDVFASLRAASPTPVLNDKTASVMITQFMDFFRAPPGSAAFESDDVLDFIEACICLSAFCCSTFEEQLVSVFRLLDYSNAGHLATDQLVRYFSVTLKLVMYLNVDPFLYRYVPISDISTVLARDVTAHFGLKVSLSNFLHWSFIKSPCLVLQDATFNFVSNFVNVSECQRLLGVQKYDYKDLFAFIRGVADETQLSHETLFQAIVELSRAESQKWSPTDVVKQRLVVVMFLAVFDPTNTGYVDVNSICAGLAVFKCPSFEEKVAAAFELHQSPKLSRVQLKSFFTSVYRMYFYLQPSFRLQAQCTEQELAHECVSNATDGIQTALFSLPQFLSNSATNESRSEATWLSLAEVRRVTGLGRTNLTQAIQLFDQATTADGLLDWSSFCECMKQIADATNTCQTNEDLQRFFAARKLIFVAFDRDNSHTLDIREFAIGLSVLCAGTQAEKISTSFKLQDVNGDEFISFGEMVGFLVNTFAILAKLEPSTTNIDDIDTLAVETARTFFRDAGQPETGLISKRKYVSMLNGEDCMDVDLIRRVSGLEYLSTAAVLDVFANHTTEASKLSARSFVEAFDELRSRSGVYAADYADDIYRTFVGEMFKAFDANGDGFVDYAELVTGLSILCAGTTADKVRTIFSLYDLNGDGLISPQELFAYLLNIYRVTFKLQPEVLSKYRCSIRDLAHHATYEIFEAADTDTDGFLSVDEFSAWYSRSSGKSTKTSEEALSDNVKSWVSLAETRTLLGLHNVSTATLLSSFFDVGAQAITRSRFVECLLSFSPVKSKKVQKLIHFLFNVFDTNKDSLVDFKEVVTGVAVICGQNIQDNLRLAFDLHDSDGDSLLSLSELLAFVRGIFTILTQLEPRTFGPSPSSVEEIVRATVQQFLRDCGLQAETLVSFNQFQNWYQENQWWDANSPPKSAFDGDAVPNLTLTQIKRITGLHAYSASDIFERFAAVTDSDGLISAAAYLQCFRSLSTSQASSPTQLTAVLTRIFNLFDKDRDGAVDFMELCSGLSVLCGGSRDDKATAAFALYDYNGDGEISFDEMTRYLTCVFVVLREMLRTRVDDSNVSAQELAEATAERAFEEAGKELTDKLTFAEFEAWHSRAGNSKPSRSPREDWLNLDEVRRLTGLGSFSADEVFELFAEATDDDGLISVEAFEACFEELVDASGEELTEDDLDRLRLILSRLYETFDADGDGVVDFTELSTGLSVLCGGTRDEKAAAAFALYDYNGDGVISLEEMTRYLTCVFKVMYETQPGTAERVGVSAEELAEATAEQAFEEADADKDGSLTFEEFQAWYSQSANEDGEESAAHAAQAVAEAAPSWVSLDEVRRLTGLGSFSVDEVFELFAEATDDDGMIGVEGFEACFEELVDASGVELTEDDLDRLRLVLCRLYEIFDSDNNGVVDFTELSTGLSVLCGGTRDEKAAAAFALYDYNGDGHISFHEMKRCLSSLYRVLLEVNDGNNSHSPANIEALAEESASHIFDVADLDGNGNLSFSEFMHWYTKSTEEGDADGGVPASASPSVLRSPLSLNSIVQALSLNQWTCSDLCRRAADFCDDAGKLSIESLHQFSALLASHDTAPSVSENAILSEVVRRIYSVFGGADGVGVSYVDIVTAFMFLCDGDRAEKAAAAFAFYDVDSSGSISFEQLCLFLSNVLKLLFETRQQSQSIALDSNDLAHIVAADIYRAQNLNLDEKLPFEMFEKQFSRLTASSLSLGSRGEVSVADFVRALKAVNARQLLPALATATDEDGFVGKNDFDAAMSSTIRRRSTLSDLELRMCSAVLFAAISPTGATRPTQVDFSDLIAALVTLCGNFATHNARLLVALLDADDSGSVSLAQAQRAVTSMLSAYFTFTSEFAVIPDMVELVCNSVFDNSAHLFEQDRVTVANLSAMFAWLLSHMYSNSKTFRVHELFQFVPDNIALDHKLRSLRALLKLESLSKMELFELFAAAADEEGSVQVDCLTEAFEVVAAQEEGEISTTDLSTIQQFSKSLYTSLSDEDGIASYFNVACALTCFMHNAQDDDALIMFELLDSDSSGFVTFESLVQLLHVRYAVLSSLVAPQRGGDRDRDRWLEAAHERVSEVYFTLGKTKSEGVTASEFEIAARFLFVEPFALEEPTILSQYTIDEIANITRLNDYTMDEIKELFEAATSPDGSIRYDCFQECFEQLQHNASDHSTAAPAPAIVHALFGLFSSLNDHIFVTLPDVIIGLSFFCQGSRREKASVGIAVVGDGDVVTMSDVESYFEIVFATLRVLKSDEFGMDDESLAHNAAAEFFNDVNAADDVPCSVFVDWYTNEQGDSAAVLQALNKCIDVESLRTVVNGIQQSNSGTTTVSAQGLYALLQRACKYSDEDTNTLLSAAAEIVCRLFQHNEDGGDEVIDLNDALVALSVLCEGTRDEKAAAAFALYDYNGDGVISLEEMTRYLTCVFKVMYETQPGTAERVGVSAEELAVATAEQAFEEADADHNGFISFEEFKRWIGDGVSIVSHGNLQFLQRSGATISFGFPRIAEHDGDYIGICGQYREKNIIDFGVAEWWNREFVSALLGFAYLSMEELASLFKAASVRGVLTTESFGRCMDEIISIAVESGAAVDVDHFYDKCNLVTARLYACFDRDHDGFVSYVDVLAGLQSVVNDDATTKRAIVLELLDSERTNTVSLTALESYFRSYFSVLITIDPSVRQDIVGSGLTMDQFIQRVVTDIAQDYGTSSGRIDKSSFELWHRQHELSGGSVAAGPASQDLSVIRRALHVEAVTFNELIDVVVENSDDGEFISIDSLINSFDMLRDLFGGSRGGDGDDLDHDAVLPAIATWCIQSSSIGDETQDVNVANLILVLAVFYGGLNDITEAGVRRVLHAAPGHSFTHGEAHRIISMTLRAFAFLQHPQRVLLDPQSIAPQRAQIDEEAHLVVQALNDLFEVDTLSFQHLSQWPSVVDLSD